MKLLVSLLEARQYLQRFFLAWLDYLYFLKATRQRVVFLYDGSVLLPRRRTNATQFTGCQSRLENGRRVERPAGGGAGANNGVHLVDEEHGITAGLVERRHDGLQPFFKIAAITRARRERAHVERVDDGVAQAGTLP